MINGSPPATVFHKSLQRMKIMDKDGLPELPIGWQGFERLRLDKAVYVDKTGYLPMVRKAGRFVFCARPRRFGKSLTVTALDAFWSGRADLFQGLAAEEVVTSPDFITRPVIRLDMSTPADSDSDTLLEEKIMGRLGVNAERHKVSLRGADSADAFQFLIEDIHKASGKHVVILIDEYDAPVISIIQREEPEDYRCLLKQTRIVIRRLYGQIKAADEHIESVFITGVTKFSRMGVFSLLNNLVDISLEPEFGAFMGYTQNELEHNFKGFIARTADELKMSVNVLLRKIRKYYDGFSFDGKIRLYNPYTILSFFKTRKFRNYWVISGSNTVIRTFLKEKDVAADQFQGMVIDDAFASAPGEIDATPPEGFLYQAGYLTLRSKGKDEFVLDYPNREVRSSISTLFLESLSPNSVWNSISKLGRDLKRPLAGGDVPGMIAVLSRLLAATVYDDHSNANREPSGGVRGKGSSGDPARKPSEVTPEEPRRTTSESFYRSILHAGLWMAGAITAADNYENMGRTDLEAVFGKFQYIIELKMADDVQGADDAVREGMLQIDGRGYRDPFLVSLAVGRKERNIVACRFKVGESGSETAVEIRLPGKP
jgi:hypothetical protein